MGLAHSTHELGAPDLKIGGFQIWVHGRAYPNAEEQYDADWLRLTAHCGAGSASVWVSGALLTSWNFAQFAHECELLRQKLEGTAQLGAVEPELFARFEATDRLGHMQLLVEITPDHLAQEHRFKFNGFDQSYLPAVISSCEHILAKYPTTFPLRK
ncbi:MAG: WapI family immunity protein [Burkholderiales bacterium]